MKHYGLYAALFFTLAVAVQAFQVMPAIAQVQQNIDIASLEGDYKVQGHNPNGSPYSGSLKISVIDGVANFRWKVGGDIFKGQGSLVGNVLVVNWGNSLPVIYTIDLDGNLAGTWDGGNASERLTRK